MGGLEQHPVAQPVQQDVGDAPRRAGLISLDE
jgi:hypothetical protein